MTETMTPLRRDLDQLGRSGAAVLLSLAVIPLIPLLYAGLFAVPAILFTAFGLVQAYRTHNLGRTGLALAATASVLAATWLIAGRTSASVSESGYLQCAVLLTSAAVLAGLAGLTILLSGRWPGLLGLVAAGALRLGADCLTAAAQAQANPAGDEDWSGLGDVIGAMAFGIIGCTFAALAALLVFRRARASRGCANRSRLARAQNSTVRSVATCARPSRW